VEEEEGPWKKKLKTHDQLLMTAQTHNALSTSPFTPRHIQ
jgi:hypothetical protein